MSGELDFSGKTVLVVGGSSGIGNGIAQSFRARGAAVHVCGTRASAADYAGTSGSDLEGLTYAQLDAGDIGAIERWSPGFDRLDVLVLSQGMVLYGRREYTNEGFAQVIDVNLNSLDGLLDEAPADAQGARGSLIIISSTAAFHRPAAPAYNARRLARAGARWAMPGRDGIRVNGIAPGFVATKMTGSPPPIPSVWPAR
jgi:3-oxoacyl-[acyl-carrier protein] reductase